MDTDYRAILTEEVALEGLDGITLQALWVRLENRVNFKMRLDEKSREFLWSCLLSIPDLEFYKLETPRGILTAKQPIQIDPDSGVTVDFDVGEDLYPIKIIKTEGSVIGSCSTYYSRQCVTMEIKPNDDSQARPTVKEAEERYGNSLVIVGSQEQRLTALCGEELDPSSLYNMADIGFCVLERIGRSRRAGELSVGESSLQVFNIQPKSMFYHSLRLIKLGILKKQSITVYNKKGQNSLRRLFHLSRFYHQYQSKYTILSNLVVNYLNDQPMKRQEITKTRQDCGIDQKSFKKLYQSYHKRFHVFTIPYNEMYPDSPESNWYTRNADLKMVRVIEVLEEESDEEEDEDGKIEDIDQDETYFPQVYEKSIVRQAMDCMEAAGAEGVSQGQMMKRLSMDNLETRMILRTLGRRGVVTSLMTESGKQKKKVMVSRSFVGGNKFITQINQEKEKLKQSLQDINKQVKEDPEKSVGEIKTEMEDKASKKKDKEKTPKKSEKEKIDEEVQGLVLNMNTQNRNFRTDIKATCRQMKRINYILDFIRENKIIDGIFPIVKMIRDNERSENLEFIVDKKSVIRLLSVLTKEQKVNAVNTVLVDGNKEKKMQMWMSKEVEPTDPLVTSLIDQANMKFQAVNREQVAKKNPKSRDLPEVPETAKEGIYQIMSHRSKLKAEDMIYDVAYSKHYDFRPKFSRAQILHNLLWYLVYDYPNTAVCPSNADLANDPGATPMKAEISNPDSSVEGDQDDIMTLINEIPEPPVYKDEMSWKRYLSPLPKHKGYGEGWFLASDVLLKLPLVIFCNILYIPYRIRGLKELLDDPEKCFYPVISLPTPLTQQLLYARKYIFSFYANCVNLNNMGLVTMGPQILKEKDKIFIYLHKRASLLDTKSSEPGYSKVRMKERPVTLEYWLVNQAMVDQYWVDLKHISLNSNLGHKDKREEGDDPDCRIQALPDCRSVQSVEDIKEDGFVPGDRLGAAGLDSNIFPHLFRNWSGVYSRTATIKTYRQYNKGEKKPEPFIEKRNNFADLQKVRNTKLSSLLPRPKARVSLKSRENSPEIIRVTLTKEVKGNKGGKGIKRKSTDVRSSIPTKKAKSFLQKIKKRVVQPNKRKFIYDDVDEEAYSKKLSQRVSWTSYEDSLLLTSKIATMVMDRKRRGVLIPWSCIRDILYEYAPKESVDKTSCACQRRVTHSLKNPSTKQNLMTYLSEAMQDPFVRKFSEKQYLQASEHAIEEFHKLASYLIKKFSNVKLNKTLMPDSLSQVNDFDISCVTQYTMKKIPVLEEPDSRAHILEYILKDIIHSYVSSTGDKQGRSHQMFRLLSQYPDTVLDSAIQKMRAEGVIVKNKRTENSKVIETGIKNIKLSQRYFFRFHSRYPNALFTNCFATIKELQRSDEGNFSTIEVKDNINGGLCAAIVQLILRRRLSVVLEIPLDVVILDPQFKEGRGYNQQMSVKRPRLQEVLDSDDEDFPLELDQKEIRPRVLELESPWELVRQIDGQSFVYDEDGKTIKEYSVGNRSTIRFQTDESLEEGRKGKEKSRMNIMCASRALVTMRRSRAEQDLELKHYVVQDNFLIQACEIKLGISEEEGGEKLPLLDIPHNREKTREIIKRVQSFIPFELDLEEVWSTVEPGLMESVKSVYNMIHSSGELGICHFYLKSMVNNWEIFSLAVKHLLDKKAILRVGITSIKYVSLPNCRPWVIHNYRDTRGRGHHREVVAEAKEDQLFLSKDSSKDNYNETLQSSTKSNTELLSEKAEQQSGKSTQSSVKPEIEDENSSTSLVDTKTLDDDEVKKSVCEKESAEVQMTATKVTSVTTQTEINESPENIESETTDGGPGVETLSDRKGKELINTRLGRYTRSRSPKKKTQEENDSIPVGPKALSTYEKVRLQIMPWKKPEGYLNKSVFSFMLQAVLLYIVSNPGISFTNICNRYLPYLIPSHLTELLEILVEIGCLFKTILTREPTLSLFSSYQAPTQVSESEQSVADCVFYEATFNAIPLLAQFLEDVQNTDSVQLHRARKRTQPDADTVYPGGESQKREVDQQESPENVTGQDNSSEINAAYPGDITEVSDAGTTRGFIPDHQMIQTVVSLPEEGGNDAISGRKDMKIEDSAGGMSTLESMDIDKAPESSHIDPAPESSRIDPAPESSCIDPAHIDPVPESSHIDPAHIDPAQESSHIDPAPESSCIDPAPESSQIDPKPESSHIEPAPDFSHIEPVPEPSHIEPAMETSHIDPTMETSHIDPEIETSLSECHSVDMT